MSSREGENGIRAMMILDVIGRPPEHLVETLGKIAEEMGKEKGVSIKAKEIKEPVVMKENKEFYTTFAEIEVETEDILYLAALMFKYMPAHIEVISPESVALSNNGWGEILSELVRRLHSYDEVARILQIEKEELLRKIQELGGAEKSEAKATGKKPKKKK
ncbi:MAG: hypothetical protein Q8P79_03680 [Nanoarchaeota archaeon]|nr:hypothetical protein [Nanoarchaeota archaeon]